jgi:NAD-dependent dihydropyrimidine dehydrogenase PreA subunit
MALIIDYKKCCFENGKCKSCSCGKACTGCVEVCPVEALSRKDKLVLDKNKCIECGACVEACKHNALKLN